MSWLLEEEVSYAVPKVVGFYSVMSAPRINSAVVIFQDTIDKVERVAETGIVLQDTIMLVYPLVNPSRKVTI